MLFDIFFFIVVMGFEVHWYLQGKKDEREFDQFKKDTYDQFLEVNKRLEISLEKEDMEIPTVTYDFDWANKENK